MHLRLRKNRGLKPHIFFSEEKKEWICHDDCFIVGYGITPESAYINWKSKESRRTRLSRRFMWNLRDCFNWYLKGCKTIRFYIGNLQIVGYDPTHDELIMRG